MADTGFCSIGTQSAAGTERFRVLDGAVLFDGTTGATPVSGAGTRFMWIPAKGALRAGAVVATAWDSANVGQNSWGMGGDSLAAGSYAGAVGRVCTALAAYTISAGYYALASLGGQCAMAGGAFVTAGDAQRSNVSLWRASTDAGSVELSLTGGAPAAGTRLTIASGKSIALRGQIVMRCTAGTNAGETAIWTIVSGGLSNVGGTTALVGTPQVAREAASSASIAVAATPTHCSAGLAAATAQITADDANDCVKVDVVGVVRRRSQHIPYPL